MNNDIDFDGVIYKNNIWVGEKGCVIGSGTGGDIEIGSDCTGSVIEPGTIGPTGCYTAKWGLLCAINSVYTVVDWIFTILMAGVAVFTIWGAYDILTSAGDPQRVESGRKKITYAMIGLAVALLSRAVPGLVRGLIG